MSTSRHRVQQKAQQQQLVENLVPLLAPCLRAGSANYKRAVKFALANLDDTPYSYPAPTAVKARYKTELDKLELNSQLSKRAALSDTLEHLQARHTFARGEATVGSHWDNEQKLWGKLALILHLSNGALARTPLSDLQVAVHKQRAATAAALDGTADSYAQQLREIAREWAEQQMALDHHENDDVDDDNNSDWSSLSESEERGVQEDKYHADIVRSRNEELGQAECAHDNQCADVAWQQVARVGRQNSQEGLHEPGTHRLGHGVPPLGYPLPLHTQTGAIDPQNPCHTAMALARQEEHDDEGTLRLWRVKHLIAHEQTVVREVIAMLRGTPGRLFELRVHSQQCDSEQGGAGGNGNRSTQFFTQTCSLNESDSSEGGGRGADWGRIDKVHFYLREPIALLHLSPQALEATLQRFMMFASVMQQLRILTSAVLEADARASCTLQALCSCVHEHLSVVDLYLYKLAMLSNNNSRVSLGNGSTVGAGAVGIGGRHASLSLLVLGHMVDKKLEIVKTLEEVLDGVLHAGGVLASPAHQAHRALSYMYAATAKARMLPDRTRYRILHRILTATMQPYLAILEKWLYEGSLTSDKRSEFFVHMVGSATDLEGEGVVKGMSDGGTVEALAVASSAASVYWQRFAIRVGGDVVHKGYVLACSTMHLQLDTTASSADDYYCGMTISVNVGAGQWESCIVTAYIGTKRRALVALKQMPAEKAEYVISTVVPPFLRAIATRVFAAGKSVNVLLVERQSQQHVSSILTQRPSVLSSFLEGMSRAAPASGGWGVHTFEIDPELRRGMLTDADEELMMLWHEENEAVDECAASEAATREAFESVSRSPSLLSSASASAGSSPAKRSNAADDERQERAGGEEVCSSCSAQGIPAVAAAQSTMELGDATAAEDGAFLGVEDDGFVCASDGDGEKRLDDRAVGSWDEGRRGGHVSGFHLSDLFYASLESPAHGREGTRRGGAGGTGDSGEGLAEEETAVDWTCESEGNVSFSPLHVPSSSLHSFLRTTSKWGVSRSEDVLESVLMHAVRTRVSTLNKAIVDYLCDTFHLAIHLSALRRVYFMAAGDALHEFALYLFNKLDGGEAWSEVEALNAMLQACLPPIPRVQYGMVTAYTAAVHHEQKIRLRAAASDKQDTSITALDSLRLDYAVAWPLNLIINPRTLLLYNEIMVFLMQIKRAKCAMSKTRRGPSGAHEAQLDGLSPAISDSLSRGVGGVYQGLKGGQNDSGDGKKKKDQGNESWIRARSKRLGATIAERYGSQDREYLVLRIELSHVVNNLENYIMNQVHSDAARDLEQGLKNALDLDDIAALHTKFLHRMRDRCLLHKKAVVVADTVRKILNLALEFKKWYAEYLSSRACLERGDVGLEAYEQQKQSNENLQRIAAELRQCMRLLVVVLEKIVARGFHPHLEDLLTRLNFNYYYDRTKGRGRAAMTPIS